VSAPGISAAYTYDTGTGRKTGETVTAAGAKTTYIVDANDRLASMSDSAGKTTYVFDALGRRTSQTLSGTTTTYTWDDASRLTSWTRGADSAIYTYDAAGQRTRTVHTQGGKTPVVTTTDYTYDGITLLSLSAAQNTTATWTVTYLYDEDGRPYAGVYTAGTTPVTFLIATNDRGDVVGLTNTAGAWFARYTYDPYGRVLAQSAQAVSGITATLASQIATRQVLRYASYAYDAHSATYYLAARHYDPATMRFLSKDPARDDGEESAYQYCAGDPVGKVDPSGEKSFSVWKVQQTTANECWLAVLRCVVAKITGTKYGLADARNKCLKYDPMAAAWMTYGIDVVSFQDVLKYAFDVVSNRKSGSLTWAELRTEIDAGRPVAVFRGSHAFVIRGYYTTLFGTKKVRVMDPNGGVYRNRKWSDMTDKNTHYMVRSLQRR